MERFRLRGYHFRGSRDERLAFLGKFTPYCGIEMKFHSLLAMIMAIASCCSIDLQAQFDTNGPNAKQLIQGVEPGIVDPVAHDVDVFAPGTFELTIKSGQNLHAPVATVMSTVQPSPAVLFTPWGGTFDIGTFDPVNTITNVIILADGYTFSSANPNLDAFWRTDGGDPFTNRGPTLEFSFQVSPAAFLAGQTQIDLSFQSIVFDPTNPPLNLDNTEMGDANFKLGRQAVALTGDDGLLTVPFLLGYTFDFHGISYSDVTICANGYLCFGGVPTITANGATNDHSAWLIDRPAIAGLLSDWGPDVHSAADGVFYEEQNGMVRVSWGDPRAQSNGGIAHSGDTDSNQFEIILHLNDGLGNLRQGEFEIHHPRLDPTTLVSYGSGLIGHTPGALGLLGGGADVSLRTTANLGSAGRAQFEEHDFAGNNASNLGWDGSGALRGYNDITKNWDSGALHFIPNPTVLNTGDAGYLCNPIGLPPVDDVQSIDLQSLDIAGGENIVISGSFLGFDPLGNGSGSVVFDPNGVHGGPFAALVTGILDNGFQSGPLAMVNPQPSAHRDAQGLLVTTPVLGSGVGGMFDLQVNFASGASFVIPVMVNPRPQLTSYTQNDDDFVVHLLSVPVTFYGTTYNELYIGSNGYITFGAGSNQNSGGQSGFNAGLGTPGTPGVAALFTDLNPIGMLSGATYEVIEDSGAGTVEVIFRNQLFWSTFESAGTVSVIFGLGGANSVDFDYSSFVPAIVGSASVTFGVSNGDPLTPITDFSNGLGTGLFSSLIQGGGSGFLSAAGGDSIAEDFLQNQALPFTQCISFRDLAVGPPFGLWLVQ